MINNIKIFNFLSHKRSILHFVPGINIIVGQTDAGKSAVIKAFKWLKDNRPLGNAFRSSWGGETKVVVNSDGNIIRKIKSDKQHLYKLNELKFKAFGNTVPEEIDQALNLDTVNLQSQFDTHFLISKSPGEVAQYFNEIARLDKIDQSHYYIDSELRKANQNINLYKSQIESFEENLEKFNYLPELEELVERVESRENTKEKVDSDLNTINNIVGKYNETYSKLSDLQVWFEIDKDLDKLKETVAKRDSVKVELTELKYYEKNIVSIDKQLQDKQSVDDSVFENVLNKKKELDQIKDKIDNLAYIFNSIDLLEEEIKDRDIELKEWEEEIHEFKGQQCPVCGNIM